MKEVTEHDVLELVARHYGIEGNLKRLNGEIDLNFFIRSSSGVEYILKIANAKESILQLELQNALMKHVRASGVGLDLQQLVPSVAGEEIVSVPWGNETRFMRLLTWIEGRVFAEVNPHSTLLLYKLGEMCGKLSKGL